MQNRSLIIINIIVLLIIAGSLITFMIFGINGKLSFNNKTSLQEIKSYENISNIKVNLKDYDLIIKESDDSKVTLEIYDNDKNNIIVNNEENNIEIKQNSKGICFGLCFSYGKVIIKLPKNYDGLLDLVTTSGDISSYVTLNNTNIKSTSGDLELDSITGSSRIKTTSGDISITSFNSSKNSKVLSTSGEVSISKLVGDIEINTTSGDININSFEILDDSKIESTSGEINIYLENNASITARSTSGEKNIEHDGGEYKLYLKTTSGDINVK